MSVQLALDAFTTLVGHVPGGRPVASDDLGTTSGTPAVRWLLSQWDDLDTARRQAAVDVLTGGRADAAASLRGVVRQRTPLEAEIESAALDIAEDFAARFSVELPPNLIVAVIRVPPERPRVLATAFGTDGAGDPVGRASVCTVTILPSLVEIYEQERRSASMAEFETTIAHEWFHCHQFLRVGMVADPSWLHEGSAEWAGLRYGFRDDPAGGAPWTYWADYFDEPQQSLFRRSYDAIGFFAHLEAGGADPWKTIDAMLGRADAEAFAIAVSRGGPAFIAHWAMGAVGDPDLGMRWRTDGPGLGTPARAELVNVGTLDNDGELVVSGAAGATVARGAVVIEEDVRVVHAAITGHGGFAFHSTSGVEEEFFEGGPTVAQVRWYCIELDGCSCPGDRAQAVRSIIRRGTSQITLAITGGTAESQVTLRGATIDELCSADEIPPGGDARCERLVALTASILGERVAASQDVDVGPPGGAVCSFPLAPKDERNGFPGGLMIMRVGVPVPEFCRPAGPGGCGADLSSAEYVVVDDVHIEYIHGGIWRSEEVRPLLFELISQLN